MVTSLAHVPGVAALIEKISAVLDSIKINTITEQHRDDGNWFIKRRNSCGRVIAKLANFYFGLAHIPIRYWSGSHDWQRWEVDCFRMLNHDRFDAEPIGNDTVGISRIPGKSLWVYLTQGKMTRKIVQAAGAELRRAHGMWSDEFNDLWSHGDASMSNCIYDEKAHRVRLIDFEIIHDKSLSAEQRHADDLLVFLLDLVGYVSHRSWLPLAISFLRAYNRPEIMDELRRRLVVPRGLARIWWNVRSNSVSCRKIRQRFGELDRAIARGLVARHRAEAVERDRQARRVSIACQVSTPGTPKLNSRKRRISASVNAACAVSPSSFPTPMYAPS
jgi:hypothetical protein